MKIKPLDLTTEYLTLKNEIDLAIQRVLTSGMYIMGEEVDHFERKMAEYLQAKHVIGVANGTDALLIAYLALDLKSGDEVITTPFTFIATIEPLSLLGVKPVFVDIEPDTYLIDPKKIEAAITPRTKAIVPVHLYGLCADMDAILEIAKKHNLRVVEDSAQAIGATINGKKAGTFGDISTFSFYPSKNLSAYGDGGMIVTNDDALAAKMKAIRVHGASKKYYHDVLGINSRLDALQAAILRVKLKYLDQWNEKRRKLAGIYAGLLPKQHLQLPVTPDNYVHTYHQFTIQGKNRDGLSAYLADKGISSGIHYPIPLHLQKSLSSLGYQSGAFPVSELSAKHVLSLPMYPQLDEQMVEEICKHVANFY